eukprot:363917-Chlamydomonas_euryale.AAC.9
MQIRSQNPTHPSRPTTLCRAATGLDFRLLPFQKAQASLTAVMASSYSQVAASNTTTSLSTVSALPKKHGGTPVRASSGGGSSGCSATSCMNAPRRRHQGKRHVHTRQRPRSPAPTGPASPMQCLAAVPAPTGPASPMQCLAAVLTVLRTPCTNRPASPMQCLAAVLTVLRTPCTNRPGQPHAVSGSSADGVAYSKHQQARPAPCSVWQQC